MSHSICSKVSKERALKRAIRRIVLAEVDALQTERDSAIKLQDEANALLIEQARTNYILGQLVSEAINTEAKNQIKVIAEQAKGKAMQQVAELLVKQLSK